MSKNKLYIDDEKIVQIKKRIYDAIKDAGMTQENLVEEVGAADRSPITRWLSMKNKTLPPIGAMIKMCEIFNCDIDYLLGNIETKTHQAKDVQEAIGLSEKAVERLISFNNYISSEKLQEDIEKHDEDIEKLAGKVQELDGLKNIGNDLIIKDKDIESKMKKILKEAKDILKRMEKKDINVHIEVKKKIEKEIEILNVIIENSISTDILGNLYKVLFEDFFFTEGEYNEIFLESTVIKSGIGRSLVSDTVRREDINILYKDKLNQSIDKLRGIVIKDKS